MKIKPFLIATLGVALAIIFLIILNFFQYYVHELGHANIAILSTFVQKNPTTTINFTYVDFPFLHYLKVPQATGATILKSYTLLFNLAGVFTTIIFYCIISFLVTKIKMVQKRKALQYSVVISFLLLILQDISLNLFCGTDGFKISCNESIKGLIFLIFNGLLLLSLGFFFVILIIFIKNNKLTKKKNDR